jgi:hypothetical protein
MKKFISLIVCILSLSSYASTKAESETVSLSGQSRSADFTLVSDEYESIYDLRTVDATCEREVWNDRCTRDSSGWNCHQGTCSPSSYDQCYSTERYSCEREEYVYVGERFIKTHTHNITLMLSEDLNLKNQTLKIKTQAEAAKLSVQLENSYSDNLIKYDVTKDAEGTLITINPIMSKELAETFKSVSLQNMKFDNGNISFDIKSGANLKDFMKVSEIHIEKNRLFNDEIIYLTPYQSHEKGGEIRPVGNDLNFLFTCKNSNIPCITKGKYDIFVTLDMGLTDFVLNVNEYLFLKKEIKGEALKARP